MDKDCTVKMETINNDFVAIEDVREEIIHQSSDNSLSKAALIAYLLS